MRAWQAAGLGVVAATLGCVDLGFLYDCPLVCPADGILDGAPRISGDPRIDALFTSVLAVRDAATLRQETIRRELEAIARSLELDEELVGALPIDELGDQLVAALAAKLDDNLQAGLTIRFTEAECLAAAELAATIAAECDPADPELVTATCDGRCEVSPAVASLCQAAGTLECRGAAPGFACAGACEGDCVLELADACAGACVGRCTGECSACVGDSCELDGPDLIRNCAGWCSGACEGTCKLEVAGECSGRCEGGCRYVPDLDEGSCSPGATNLCAVAATPGAVCEGACEDGSDPLAPAGVSLDCQIAAGARADAAVVCRPPSLTAEYLLRPELDADARAAFRVWLAGFEARLATLLAAGFELDNLAGASARLATAAEATLPDIYDGMLDREGLGLREYVGVACALDELGGAAELMADSLSATTRSLAALNQLVAAVGG